MHRSMQKIHFQCGQPYLPNGGFERNENRHRDSHIYSWHVTMFDFDARQAIETTNNSLQRLLPGGE